MTALIDTLGKAARHRMLVLAECRLCGRQARFYAEELCVFYGRGRDPRSLKFRCERCDQTTCTVTVVDQAPTSTPDLIVWRPVRVKPR